MDWSIWNNLVNWQLISFDIQNQPTEEETATRTLSYGPGNKIFHLNQKLYEYFNSQIRQDVYFKASDLYLYIRFSTQYSIIYIIYVSQDDYINISSKKVNKQTTGDDRERKRLKNSSKDNKYFLVPDSSFLSDNHLIEKLRGYL